MKKLLVLGAGFVARPFVDYILTQTDYHLTVADIDEKASQKLTAGHDRATAVRLDVNDQNQLASLIAESDLTMSLLPYDFHTHVAKVCVEVGRPMVTTSYAREEIYELDAAARDKGVLILKEVGLDPGLDHMSAMEIIHRLQSQGKEITSFKSYCGGVPSPEADNNPWHYKFSWSPRGVLLAAKSGATWLQDKRVISVENNQMPASTWPVHPTGLQLEAYPNRDSLSYIESYGLNGISTLVRCTLRYPGWMRLLAEMNGAGLLSEKKHQLPAHASWNQALAIALGQHSEADLADILSSAGCSAETIDQLSWLGLFASDAFNSGASSISAFELVMQRMQARLVYTDSERDMVVLYHEFEYKDAQGQKRLLTSGIDVRGEPGGVSAMAKTVALPAAICCKLILEQKIRISGVQIPVIEEIYGPALRELASMDIVFKESENRIID